MTINLHGNISYQLDRYNFKLRIASQQSSRRNGILSRGPKEPIKDDFVELYNEALGEIAIIELKDFHNFISYCQALAKVAGHQGLTSSEVIKEHSEKVQEVAKKIIHDMGYNFQIMQTESGMLNAFKVADQIMQLESFSNASLIDLSKLYTYENLSYEEVRKSFSLLFCEKMAATLKEDNTDIERNCRYFHELSVIGVVSGNYQKQCVDEKTMSLINTCLKHRYNIAA